MHFSPLVELTYLSGTGNSATMPAAVRSSALMVWLILSLSGCRGCQTWGASSQDPRLYLDPSATAVVELSSLEALLQLDTFFQQKLGHVISDTERSELKNALRRALGLDPFTREGLNTAGLPAKGRIAGTIENDSSFWVFPVKDADMARAFIQKMVEAQAVAEHSELAISGHNVDIFYRVFGSEQATVAAFTVSDGVGLLGLGTNAEQSLEDALKRTPETSLLTSEIYKAAAKPFHEAWVVRILFPKGAQAINVLGEKLDISLDPRAQKDAKNAGWSLGLTQEGIKIRGSVTWMGATLSKIQNVTAVSSALNKSVEAAHVSQAAVSGSFNGSPKALLELLFPEGSKPRIRLKKALEEQSLSEEQLLNILNGQTGWSLGIKDLSSFSLAELTMNPTKALWGIGALGVNDKKSAQEIRTAVGEILDGQGYVEKKVVLAGQEVIFYELQTGFLKPAGIYSFDLDDAMLFVLEKTMAEKILTSVSTRASRQGWQGTGFHTELHPQTVAKQLSTFRVGQIPLLFRGFVSKGLEAISAFKKLELSLQTQDDRTVVSGLLVPAPPAQDSHEQ